MINVLIICSGGMSSAIVVNAIKTEAAKENIEINIKSIGTGEFTNEIENNWDLVLVAPQIRHRFDNLKMEAKEKDIPIELILPQNYSPLGGENLMEQIKKYL